MQRDTLTFWSQIAARPITTRRRLQKAAKSVEDGFDFGKSKVDEKLIAQLATGATLEY